MQEKYAADMDYASFSIEDIRLLSENLANRTEWIDILIFKAALSGKHTAGSSREMSDIYCNRYNERNYFRGSF